MRINKETGNVILFILAFLSPVILIVLLFIETSSWSDTKTTIIKTEIITDTIK